MTVVSISLPTPLLKEMDRLAASGGFSGRSDYVRAALREFVNSQLAQERHTGARSATLTALYPAQIERRVGEIAHDFGDVIRSMMHAHVGEARCITVYITGGDAQRIRELAGRLGGLRDAEMVRLTYTDAGTKA
jgi:CopG family nickel-responsive transcriptional regulator